MKSFYVQYLKEKWNSFGCLLKFLIESYILTEVIFSMFHSVEAGEAASQEKREINSQ